ncbi:unnamed protein product [Urochloa decumbens]|uniref:Uncharacterized protein n=1 Tax=Urochloa decumbens TaxID=240449 RepID=A0ABC9AST4_9POAL
MTIFSKPAAVGSITPAESAMVVREVREVDGSRVLTIDGYSRTKGLRYAESISHIFMAAGHRWCIRYYPNGDGSCDPKWISMHLQLYQSYFDVKARCTISLLDSDGRPVPSCTHVSKGTHTFAATGLYNARAIAKFIKRKDLEKSAYYLCGDSFRVRCDITVITETIVPPAMPVIVVPPPDNIIKEAKKDEDAPPERFVIVPAPDMHRHLAHLLSSGEGANVALEVDGETFKAHRSILARSPVFKAELLSPMEEGTSTSCVSIKDIEARIFKAMLHFIYTDSLPDIDEGEAMVMAQKLLAAADRYGLERLKLICQDKLCNYVDTTSVGTILALAEQHRCDGLKKACLKFLMSGSNLKAAIETDGFDHLANSCPSVLKELLAKVVL